MDLPPVMENCDACDEEPGPGAMLRCSVCKNRFYCSARCQKADWKAHKFHCSPLPIGDTAAPASFVDTDMSVFDPDVEHATEMLKRWLDAVEKAQEHDENARIAPLPESKAFRDIAIPPAFGPGRAAQDAALFPYRQPILALARLFFTRLVARLAPDERAAMAAEFVRIAPHMPSSFGALYGPKMVARPADLSPGEYALLTSVLPMFVIPGTNAWADDAERVRWNALGLASKKLYSVKRAPPKATPAT